VVRDILEQYEGNVIASGSALGGTRMEVVFQRQEVEHRRE